VLLAGNDVTAARPDERRRLGMALVLEEGSRSGLLPTSPLWENVTLGHSRTAPLCRGLWIDRRAARRRARDLCAELGVRPANVEAPAFTLSGGNQQKLVVGRELAGRPRLLLIAHPTQGVDVAARDVVHGALGQARRDGTAIVVVSSDPEELAALADVVLVLRRGRVTARLDRAALSAERLSLLMAGGSVR
jgi:simple sugar transport system ATP-binding protein